MSECAPRGQLCLCNWFVIEHPEESAPFREVFKFAWQTGDDGEFVEPADFRSDLFQCLEFRGGQDRFFVNISRQLIEPGWCEVTVKILGPLYKFVFR